MRGTISDHYSIVPHHETYEPYQNSNIGEHDEQRRSKGLETACNGTPHLRMQRVVIFYQTEFPEISKYSNQTTEPQPHDIRLTEQYGYYTGQGGSRVT